MSWSWSRSFSQLPVQFGWVESLVVAEFDIKSKCHMHKSAYRQPPCIFASVRHWTITPPDDSLHAAVGPTLATNVCGLVKIHLNLINAAVVGRRHVRRCRSTDRIKSTSDESRQRHSSDGCACVSCVPLRRIVLRPACTVAQGFKRSVQPLHRSASAFTRRILEEKTRRGGKEEPFFLAMRRNQHACDRN